jgi:hypothetical protein
MVRRVARWRIQCDGGGGGGAVRSQNAKRGGLGQNLPWLG